MVVSLEEDVFKLLLRFRDLQSDVLELSKVVQRINDRLRKLERTP